MSFVDDRPVNMVLNFHKTGGYVLADLIALAATVDAWFSEDLLPHLTAALTYSHTRSKGLALLIDQESTADEGAGVGGVTATPPMQLNCALCITHRTAYTGRSARGRTFVGGLPEGARDTPTTIDAGYAATVAAAFALLRLASSAIDWDFSVLSRYSEGVARATATSLPIVTSGVTDLRSDSQRRRLG